MNKRERLTKRNDTIRKYTRPGTQGRPHRNANYVRGGNSLEHELMKTQLIWEYRQEGKEVITEAQHEDGHIADIVVLDTGEEVEVVKSNLSDKNKADRVVEVDNFTLVRDSDCKINEVKEV